MTGTNIIYGIYSDVVRAFRGIADGVYLGRPKTIARNAESFIVVEIRSDVDDIAAGSGDYVLSTWGVATLFVRAKTDGTMNVQKQTSLLEKMRRVFPVRGVVCACTKPVARMTGADSGGFHTSQIVFKIRTYTNVIK